MLCLFGLAVVLQAKEEGEGAISYLAFLVWCVLFSWILTWLAGLFCLVVTIDIGSSLFFPVGVCVCVRSCWFFFSVWLVTCGGG